MQSRSTLLGSAVFATLLAGCTNLSGVGGSSEYSCKAQPGVRCESVSRVYQDALQRNLPSQQPSSGTGGVARPSDVDLARTARAVTTAFGASQPVAAAGATQGAMSATALRSPARILRLWFKPWEDADGDLFDQGYIYVQVDGGRWMVDHAQRHARDGYRPVRPPRTAAAPSPAAPVAMRPTGARPRDAASAEDSDAGAEDAIERLSALKQIGSGGTQQSE